MGIYYILPILHLSVFNTKTSLLLPNRSAENVPYLSGRYKMQ